MDTSAQDCTPVGVGGTSEVSEATSQQGSAGSGASQRAATSLCACEEAQPWWHSDPCPTWCVTDHAADEPLHTEDRAHVAKVAHVPVIRAGQPPFRRGEDMADAAEYIVIMRRYVGQTDTWVYIGEGENVAHSLEVTAESARRLGRAIAKVVG